MRANGFQCEAIAIMSFILDITRVRDLPLITVFDKGSCYLAQYNCDI